MGVVMVMMVMGCRLSVISYFASAPLSRELASAGEGEEGEVDYLFFGVSCKCMILRIGLSFSELSSTSFFN